MEELFKQKEELERQLLLINKRISPSNISLWFFS